jgi:adenylate cyclase class 2
MPADLRCRSDRDAQDDTSELIGKHRLFEHRGSILTMPRNIELKARCADLPATARRAIAVGAVDRGVLLQHDTFYAVTRGRLKLRRIAGAPAELILYHRPDTVEAKASEYHIAGVPDPEALHRMLAVALGVTADVRKRRRLLLWKYVRIHLDEVENLGTFIELESVVGPDADEAEASRRLDELRAALAIDESDLVGVAYAQLLAPGS